MADEGLLAAGLIGTGLQAGVDAYQKQRAYDDERQFRRKMLSLQMLKGGYREDQEGALVETPEHVRERTLEEQTKQSQLLKAGYKPVLNEATNQYTGLEPVPGFHDLEQENKRLINQRLQKEVTEGKKPTTAEFAASGYAQRLEQSENVFNDLSARDYDSTGLLSQAQKALPSPLGFLKDENTKLQQQAEDNFLNAVLRRESGASISDQERANGKQQYFPQPGDTPEVLKQKALNRQIVRENLRAEAGRAYEKSGGGLLAKTRKGGLIQEPGGQAIAGGMEPDVEAYAKTHRISVQQAAAIKAARTGRSR